MTIKQKTSEELRHINMHLNELENNDSWIVFFFCKIPPGNAVNGLRTCVERSGGNSGGNCPNGSWSVDMEDDVGGEIIDISTLCAIS